MHRPVPEHNAVMRPARELRVTSESVPLNSAPFSFPVEGRLIKCFHLCSIEAQDIDNKLKTRSGLGRQRWIHIQYHMKELCKEVM